MQCVNLLIVDKVGWVFHTWHPALIWWISRPSRQNVTSCLQWTLVAEGRGHILVPLICNVIFSKKKTENFGRCPNNQGCAYSCIRKSASMSAMLETCVSLWTIYFSCSELRKEFSSLRLWRFLLFFLVYSLRIFTVILLTLLQLVFVPTYDFNHWPIHQKTIWKQLETTFSM